MIFSKENRHHTFNGILFACLFALSSFYIADLKIIKSIGLSPLVLAIILGMIYGSTLRKHLPHEWKPGIQFAAKKILRVAIIFYGFRITFQDIFQVGLNGFILDILIVVMTMLSGTFFGIKILKFDRDSSILISSGASICGAAAILATEGVLKSAPHKAALAVITVVLFGSILMFIYPIIYKLGWLNFTEIQYGIFSGATIHEVAQVVVAGSQISPTSGNIAIIVKMTRVMLLAPMLVGLSMVVFNKSHKNLSQQIIQTIPWFAILFIIMVGINSLHIISNDCVDLINNLDLFLLTMSMSALGIETDFAQIKSVGMKPLYLSLYLFIWLIFIGYGLTYLLT